MARSFEQHADYIIILLLLLCTFNNMFTFPTIFVVLEFNIIMANSITAIRSLILVEHEKEHL